MRKFIIIAFIITLSLSFIYAGPSMASPDRNSSLSADVEIQDNRTNRTYEAGGRRGDTDGYLALAGNGQFGPAGEVNYLGAPNVLFGHPRSYKGRLEIQDVLEYKDPWIIRSLPFMPLHQRILSSWPPEKMQLSL